MQVRSLGRDDPLEDCSNPLHYSCLENPMDRRARKATIHRTEESDMTKET